MDKRSSNMIDMLGKKYQMLTVIALSKRKTNKGELMWECLCDCGKTHTTRGSYLRKNKIKSCGCIQTRHGMTMSKTWCIWRGMIQRCRNVNNKSYPNYGGRGISICERWMKFENFFADMGKRPRGKSIDRIDNNGNYEPGNCRWVSPLVQSTNTRMAKRCRILGVEYPTIGAAARSLKIHRATVQYRFNRNTPGYELC